MKLENGKSFPVSAAAHLMRLIVSEDVAQLCSPRKKIYDPNRYCITQPPLPIAALMAINPNYWIPEAYCRRYWDLLNGDLADFLTLAQESAPTGLKGYMSLVQNPYSITHILKQKIFTRYFSRLVRTHYDICPEIYECFLDEEMVYTCAFFDNVDCLSNAQQKKFSTIMERLELPENPAVLNIGCGWGSFERFVVRNSASATVTGLSISEAQIAWANAKNRASLDYDMNSRIVLLKEDYACYQPEKAFDAITAIGMVEHVGQSGYREFFRRSYSFLKPRGTLLIHMIVKSKSNVPTNSWIDRYIFPGGYSPSISELTRGAEGVGFRTKNIHIHHPDNYANTIREWRRNLHDNRERVFNIYCNLLGIEEPEAEVMFRRWDFYLSASESSFRVKDGPLQIAHFVFEKYW